MTDSLSIAVHVFVSRVSMSFSVDETLFLWKVKLSTSFRELPPSVEVSPVWLKHMYSLLIDMEANACGGLFQIMQ